MWSKTFPFWRLLGNDLPQLADWEGYSSIDVVAESRKLVGEAPPCCHTNSLGLIITCLPHPRQPKTWWGHQEGQRGQRPEGSISKRSGLEVSSPGL